MVQLTSSGEVAQFIDDDQFGNGQSVDKCGPEVVSLFWHSVKPGQHNPYTSAEVHTMAHDDYVQFIGPDVRGDQAGTGDQTLYDMLKFHGFHYEIGPLEWPWIDGWLNAGYPVIIGGVQESTVHDQALDGAVPYAWNTSGLYHIILASGPGGLFRDTANIGPSGVRPGPRRYNTNDLRFTTATMVVPTWLPVPGGSAPPAPPAPPAKTYTVRSGDYLGEIAQRYGIAPVSKLYLANESVIEQTARAHGFASSENGRWIFPDEVLAIP